MFFSEFNERSRSNPLCDFRLGTVATSDHETPLTDKEGHRRTVTQAEGGEQGDPLMPLLFSIGIQHAVEEVASAMLPGEQLRVGPLCKLLEEALLRNPGIHLHQGKTKIWNRAGVIPEDIHEGDDAWHPEGINVLGTPVGSGHFIALRKSAICGERSPQCLTCSVRGSFSCKVPIPQVVLFDVTEFLLPSKK